MLTETATRVLASTESFSATDAAGAANVAALQRVGSFPAPVGVDLAEALRTTAHAAPCGLSVPAPGDGAGSKSSPAAGTLSTAAAAAAAVEDSDDEGLGRTSLRGSDAGAAPGAGASPGQTAAAGAEAPASAGGAAAEANRSDGGARPVSRLRGGAGPGEHALSRSDPTAAGGSSASAAAAAPNPRGGGSPEGAKPSSISAAATAPDPRGSGSPEGAKPAKSPLAAAPVLGSSEAANARNGGISAEAADSVGAGSGGGAEEGSVTGQDRKKESFLQTLSPLRLIRASGRSGSARAAPGTGAPDADSQDELQYAGQSDEDLRHEQVTTASIANSPEFL